MVFNTINVSVDRSWIVKGQPQFGRDIEIKMSKNNMSDEKVYLFLRDHQERVRGNRMAALKSCQVKSKQCITCVHKYIRLLSALMMAAGNAPEKRAFFHQTRDTFRYR